MIADHAVNVVRRAVRRFNPALKAAGLENLAEVIDVSLEIPAAEFGHRHARARAIVVKILFDLHVTCFVERRDVGAEIAFGRARNCFQAYEFKPLIVRQGSQRCQYLEPQRLMDQIVGLIHATRSSARNR